MTRSRSQSAKRQSMEFQVLSEDNVRLYIEYLKAAMAKEPDMMIADRVDEEGILKRVGDPFYQGTVSLLAIENGNVVGRIEYHFYGCMQDGYRMAYVDWVYVLPEHRHRGIARGLFAEFEKDCRAHGTDQYYLIRATNPDADKFYHSFEGAELNEMPFLRKDIKRTI